MKKKKFCCCGFFFKFLRVSREGEPTSPLSPNPQNTEDKEQQKKKKRREMTKGGKEIHGPKFPRGLEKKKKRCRGFVLEKKRNNYPQSLWWVGKLVGFVNVTMIFYSCRDRSKRLFSRFAASQC